MEKYRYAPLEHGYTRCLQIDGYTHEGTLLGRLSVMPVPSPNASNPSDYKALSYCWGTSERTDQLVIAEQRNDKTTISYMSITPNVAKFLKQFAQNEPSRLWIDQICINQYDIVEKSSMIPLMSRIYLHAQQVVVWLGEETPLLQLALKAITLVASSPDTRIPASSIQPPAMPTKALATYLSQTLQTDPNKCQLALESFFKQPWFSRLWVIQEICLGSEHSATVMCGSLSIAWRDIDAFFCSPLYEDGAWLFRDKLEPAAALVHNRRHFKTSATSEILLPLFVTLLEDTRSYGFREPRDRYGALISLLEPQIKDLPFDYSWSVDETLIIWARIIIDGLLRGHYRNPFALLASAGTRNHSETLPSWVPDWNSLILDRRPTTFGGSLSSHLACGYDWCPRLHRCGEYERAISGPLVNKSRFLRVTGVEVSRIGATSPMLDEGPDGRQLMDHASNRWSSLVSGLSAVEREALAKPQPMIQWWLELIRVQESPFYKSKEEKEDAFARIVMNQNHTHRNSDALTDRDKYATIRHIFQLAMAYWMLDENEPAIAALAKSQKEQTESPFLVGAQTAALIVRTCAGHRFMVSKHGHFGLVPSEAKAGDVITVLLGGQSPFILRRKTVGAVDQYSVIGDCYVDRLMEGQAVMTGGRNLRPFLLC
jgi:hypothetical protein